MFRGNYNFFEYKYNISGYTGQDYGAFPQYLYLLISIVLLMVLLFSLRRISQDKTFLIVRILSIFMILFYLIKTIWESIYDIKILGSFNTGLLPLDTCSIVMIAGVFASFFKGRIRDYSICWLTTGGIVGGIGTMITLNAFKYYPFLSFGAFYSMIWHFLMVFIGLLLVVTDCVRIDRSVVFKGYLFHLILSIIVIPIDYIFNFDFMMYKKLGGIPLFQDIGEYLSSNHLSFLNTIIMLILYFIAFYIAYLLDKVIKRRRSL